MFVRRAYIPEALRPDDLDNWPYTVPAVAELARDGLEFRSPVTFLVGDNGSGESTLVEAIAEGFKLDAQGGRAAARTGRPDPTLTPLGEVLRLETTYWDKDTATMSHGEGFLAVFRSMFADAGFYVMDEPESALSFTACLQLVALMHELVDHWRRYLTDPGTYLRHITDE